MHRENQVLEAANQALASEADWRKFRNKEAARRPPWLTDGIDGRGLCTLIFSVALSFLLFLLIHGQKPELQWGMRWWLSSSWHAVLQFPLYQIRVYSSLYTKSLFVNLPCNIFVFFANKICVHTLRGHVQMTSVKFSGFWTPSRFSAFMTEFLLPTSAFVVTSSPSQQCRRLLYMAPKMLHILLAVPLGEVSVLMSCR